MDNECEPSTSIIVRESYIIGTMNLIYALNCFFQRNLWFSHWKSILLSTTEIESLRISMSFLSTEKSLEAALVSVTQVGNAGNNKHIKGLI